jgi:hypothetical protein
MATEEEKERNKRLREEAMAAKFARETRQTANNKAAVEDEPPPPKPEPPKKPEDDSGGLFGRAKRALQKRVPEDI